MQAVIKLGGKPILIVNIKDCRVDTFRAGGKGGQNQNKVESGVRVVHEPSGASAEARDSRDQPKNRRAAFERMAAKPEFRAWAKIEVSRIVGYEIAERERRTSQKGEKIRTYHEPRASVLDHRTSETYGYDDVLNGKGLDAIVADCVLWANGMKRAR
jgi:protein subunit release factor A